MAKKFVTDYKVSWDVNRDKPTIQVKVEGSNRLSKLPLSNHDEFQSLLALLQGPKSVFIDFDRAANRFIVATT